MGSDEPEGVGNEPALFQRAEQLPLGDRASLLAAAIIEAAVDWRRSVVTSQSKILDRLRAAGANEAQLDDIVAKGAWPPFVDQLIHALNRALRDASPEVPLLQPSPGRWSR